MTSRRSGASERAPVVSPGTLKTIYYGFTALNTLASSYYFNYLFFYLRDTFGFGNRENLAVAGLHGLIYIFSAWQCGRFAQRHGAHTSLAIGFGGLAACMVAGAWATSPLGQIVVLAIYSVVLLFIWPALEALVAEGEPAARVPHMVGVYNCTWATAAALAYFTGGMLYDWLGSGAVFWIPAALFLAEWFVVLWLTRVAGVADAKREVDAARAHVEVQSAAVRKPKVFLTLGWIANPFAYVAMYTVIAVMPSLAESLSLSPAEAGLVCSVWFFVRLAAFASLWQWEGWHYRFSWLALSYAAMSLSFVVMLLVPSVSAVVAAQVVFGASCGLIYYSSLYYSMDVDEGHAEHGGIHEAAIGAGIFAGPAVGAASLYVAPGHQAASVYAVAGLLAAGLATMVGVWRRACRRR